jgi:hypothetical protein
VIQLLRKKVYQQLFAGISAVFIGGTPIFSTNETDRHNSSELLLKLALNTQ